MRIVVGLVLWLNTAACIWWLIAAVEQSPASWVDSREGGVILVEPLWVQYEASLYWGELPQLLCFCFCLCLCAAH